MSDFDDRSGIVPSEAPWGRWWQTMEDVTVEVVVPQGTRSKEITCTIKPCHLHVTVKGQTVISVNIDALFPNNENLFLINSCLIFNVREICQNLYSLMILFGLWVLREFGSFCV